MGRAAAAVCALADSACAAPLFLTPAHRPPRPAMTQRAMPHRPLATNAPKLAAPSPCGPAMKAALQHSWPETPAVTDADLTYMAQAALTWTRSLPPGMIRARAQGGWLTLTGEVRWHYQRQDAIDCVSHLPGLIGISNFITVRPPTPGQPQLVT